MKLKRIDGPGIDHSTLPAIRTAILPAKYEAAKVALAECNRIDECKDWADKSKALASYANQSQDKKMMKMAMRIRARAIRRCGELLKEFEANHTGRIRRGEAPNSSTRKSVAKMAGLSADQAKDALRVANIDSKTFEKQVESDNPPTVTKLAEQGKNNGVPIYERLGITKKAFQAGMYFIGSMEKYAKECAEYDPQDVIDGSAHRDREEIKRNMQLIEKYHAKLRNKL